MTRDQQRLANDLAHIIEAIERIDRYTGDMDEVAFLNSQLVQDAVIRNFEIIGEASNNIEKHYPDFAASHPELPLSFAYQMRNAVAHGYFKVDFEIVWKTIHRDLPGLRSQIQDAQSSVYNHGSLVVSCGRGHSQCPLVVEPGGHVGRSLVGLSTCPSGDVETGEAMSVEVEALFTSALGLQPPWEVKDVKLDTAKRRIDFEIVCQGKAQACPACGAGEQPVHDRLRRSWRHLDFFQFEAWLHCDVPRIACDGCGKTTQLPVPWARPGSGFTAAFEALALALCRELPVRQAASLLRCADKQLWRRIESHVGQARALESFAGVHTVGVDETSLRRGQNYITVVHDLDAKRLLFATEGRDHQTVVDFAADLQLHGGEPAEVRHVCMDMSAAYAKGVGLALPRAQISYDRFHVVAMANEAMDLVRRAEMRDDAPAVRSALGTTDAKTLKQLTWGMRRNPSGWSCPQLNAMHWLQHSTLKSARAWRLKMALREVYARARAHNSTEQAGADLSAWLSWARRCRLEPFKKLATTIKDRFDAVVRGMTDHRSNAFVEAMNGLLQQAKRAAKGFRTATNFIAIAYLRMSKLKHLPAHPFCPANAQ